MDYYDLLQKHDNQNTMTEKYDKLNIRGTDQNYNKTNINSKITNKINNLKRKRDELKHNKQEDKNRIKWEKTNKKLKKLEEKLNQQNNTKIGCVKGHKMMQITTMNVDTLRTMDSIDAVLTNLHSNNIDVACIQETHNNRNDHMERENYNLFSGEKEQGGNTKQ